MVLCPCCKEPLGVLTHVHAEKHGFKSKEELIKAYGVPKKVIDNFNRDITVIPKEIDDWIKTTSPKVYKGDFINY